MNYKKKFQMTLISLLMSNVTIIAISSNTIIIVLGSILIFSSVVQLIESFNEN